MNATQVADEIRNTLESEGYRIAVDYDAKLSQYRISFGRKTGSTVFKYTCWITPKRGMVADYQTHVMPDGDSGEYWVEGGPVRQTVRQFIAQNAYTYAQSLAGGSQF